VPRTTPGPRIVGGDKPIDGLHEVIEIERPAYFVASCLSHCSLAVPVIVSHRLDSPCVKCAPLPPAAAGEPAGGCAAFVLSADDPSVLVASSLSHSSWRCRSGSRSASIRHA